MTTRRHAGESPVVMPIGARRRASAGASTVIMPMGGKRPGTGVRAHGDHADRPRTAYAVGPIGIIASGHAESAP